MSADNSKGIPPRTKDETGSVHGMLTVHGFSHTTKTRGAYWHCRCECGNTTTVAGASLRSGAVRSCGCVRVKDMSGQKFGRLTVIEIAEIRTEAHWRCQCECGNITVVAGSDLRKGSTVSCGCKRRSQGGGCGTPEYISWKEMKRRCCNKGYREYHNYGGRGIRICDRWIDSFEAFLEDMGPKPFPEATIDRIDNNGNYEPDNCRWADKLTQAQNSRKARMITYNGETLCLRAWARRIGITHRTLSLRLDRGWPLEKALTTPANTKFLPHK